MFLRKVNCILKKDELVPDVEAGCCYGPEGNGVSLGGGDEGGPGPPGCGKDKQSVLGEGRDNMGKDEEDRPDKLDMMKKDRREQNERFSKQDRRNYVIMFAELILSLCFFFFRRINHMTLKNYLH